MASYSEEVIQGIKNGKLAVFPTDTLYGIHASALNPTAVEKIYEVRGRSSNKPMIVLICSIDQIKQFDIQIDNQTKEILNKYWPGKVSIALPCPNKKFSYLHRGTNTIAFRMPDKADLLKFLDKTGPLTSTSVNPEGLAPAKTIVEAKKYFGEKIDFYVDGGILDSEPSTLISVTNGEIQILRQGIVKIYS